MVSLIKVNNYKFLQSFLIGSFFYSVINSQTDCQNKTKNFYEIIDAMGISFTPPNLNLVNQKSSCLLNR